MGVKVTGQFEPAGEFSIVDAKDVSGNITSSNIQLSGNISGSTTSTGSFGRLEIIGNSVLGGDLDLTGNITIGDSDTDSLTITADLTSNLIPNADSTFNLGSPTKNWKEGYIEELSSTNITASGDISGSGISTGSLALLHVSQKIGVGTLSPLATVHISASDGLIIPVGNNAQRSGDAVVGEIRFNTDAQTYEGYDGNNWGSLGGMTDVDKDTFITAENSAGADNDELKFFTAGVERLRIFANGHISASGNITASGNIVGTNLVADSSSFSTRITAITSSISALKTDSGSFSTRISTEESNVDALQVDSSSFSTRITDLKTDSGSFSARITTEESNVDALQIDSASFSTRVTNLKIDSGSFSLRNTNLETTASAMINNFDQVQSLGKTDNVDFNNITTTGNVSGSMTSTGSFGRTIARSGRYSDLQITDDLTVTDDVGIGGVLTATGGVKLGNALSDTHEVTGSLTVTSDNLTVEGNGSISASLTSTGSFGMIKKEGLDIREHFSRNLAEAFELDSNGDFQPSPMNKYIVDTKWDLDNNGDLQMRERELWTLFPDDYFSD